MRIGSLFSGVGGLEKGLEDAGLGEVIFQVERDPYCRSVLARHWPNAVRFDDVRTVSAAVLSRIDLLCGGFPCQDLSSANVRGRPGLDGDASGLWREYDRLIGDLGPRWVVIENVGRVWDKWVPVVRRDLGLRGYASVPLRLSTADVGAPHHRDRVFVLAHADAHGQRLRTIHEALARISETSGRSRGPWRDAFTGVVRLADGVPGRMGAVRAYGNAVSPPVARIVGEVITMLECAA